MIPRSPTTRFLVAVGLLSAVYAAIGWDVDRLGFLSNASAFLVDKALVIRSTGELESAGFVYPPVPLGIAWVLPNALALSLIGAVAMGTFGALLLHDWSQTYWSKSLLWLLLGVLLLSPVGEYLATQELSASLGMVWIYLAFRAFRQYTRGAALHDLVVGGLWLALAFFTTPIATAFAVGFAGWIGLQGPTRTFPARAAAVWVLLFPTMAAVAIWGYLSWLFTGQPQLLYPLALLKGAGVGQALWGSLTSIVATIGEGWADPVTAVLVLLPVAVMALTPRVSGGSWVEMITLDTGIALALWPPTVRRWPAALLAAAAVMQGVGTYVLPVLPGEMATWYHVWASDALQPQDAVDEAVARRLVQAPPHSILTDDRMTYRLIAEAHTTRPFVLPTRADFTPAAAHPAGRVAYVLVGPSATASPLDRYRTQPPPGMVLDATFNGYRLYRAVHAPPLLHAVPQRPGGRAAQRGAIGYPNPG